MAEPRQDSIDRHVARWRDELDYLNPVHEAVVARLMILSRHLAGTRDSAHEQAALPRPSFKILLALRRLGAPYTASPSDLADHLGLSRGALSARLGPLEDDGLVTRTVDKDDRRRVHVRLTAAGPARLRPARPHRGQGRSRPARRPVARRPAPAGRPAARAGARGRGS